MAVPVVPIPSPANRLPRIITYYQTLHDGTTGRHVSVLPLLTQPGIGLTHLILAAIHLNGEGPGPASPISLNDHAPSHPRFDPVWAEMRVLQASGVKVLALLGGAAAGSFARLDYPPGWAEAPCPHTPAEEAAADATFERNYRPLADMVRERALDGLDLDVEEPMSLAGIVRLIDRLKRDFGRSFLITLAPVAAALLDPRRNLSGFDYEALEVMRGGEIAWYNAQFYCGWGDCSNPAMYELVLARGWPPEKVVVGLVTNPANGSGWVPWDVIANVIPLIRGRHPRFGGVMGWEYFNSLPGGQDRPWEWARTMTAILGPQRTLEAGTGDGRPGAADERRAASREVDPDDDTHEEARVPKSFDYHSDGIHED